MQVELNVASISSAGIDSIGMVPDEVLCLGRDLIFKTVAR